MNLFFNRQLKKSEIASLFVVAIFTAAAVWARQIQLKPFWYHQEYSVLVFGRMPENIGQHPLFYSNSFVPLLHYLPYSLLRNEIFVVVAVFVMAAAPWLLLFLCLRRLSISPLAALLAVVVTFYVGTTYALDYLQEPNPFMIFRYVNFRMIIFPIVGLFIYFCATRRWLLAGLAMGLIGASHAKFGAKLWLLTTIIIVVLAIWRNAPLKRPNWRNICLLQLGFFAAFAFTAWQLVYASIHLAQLNGARASELISPFGYLLKNEPDDFLFLFNPSKQIYGAFILAATGALLSLWLTFYGRISALRELATIGLISNIVALLAFAFEAWFETMGMSLLPSATMLKVFLLRPWDFLWVAPLTLGVLGSLALSLQPRQPIGSLMAAVALAICATGSIQQLTSAPAPRSLVDRIEHTVSAVPNYTRLTICSSLADQHKRAKEAGIRALWNRDRQEFDRAIEQMNLLFRQANNSFPKLNSDPEADNLRAMFDFRTGNYASGYAILLSQNALILNPAPNAYGWMGDVTWECNAYTTPESIGFQNVVKPWKDFAEATAWIEANAPARSRVINMPSLTPVMSRTKHVSFWETQIDSHPMYSFPGYYGIGLDRLEAIAGPNSIELSPGFRYGDPGEAGRQAFLSLTRENFKRISEKYGPYEFILTERQHRIDLPLVYSNESFAVYRQ